MDRQERKKGGLVQYLSRIYINESARASFQRVFCFFRVRAQGRRKLVVLLIRLGVLGYIPLGIEQIHRPSRIDY